MCKVYQVTKEFVCQSTVYVDCPRNSQRSRTKTVSIEKTFAPLTEQGLPATATKRRCDTLQRRNMFSAANGWLITRSVTAKNRYNLSLAKLLSADGFVRGPLRQACLPADSPNPTPG